MWTQVFAFVRDLLLHGLHGHSSAAAKAQACMSAWFCGPGTLELAHGDLWWLPDQLVWGVQEPGTHQHQGSLPLNLLRGPASGPTVSLLDLAAH